VREKNFNAVALGRLGGSKGGRARAEKLSPERRREIALHASKFRWEGGLIMEKSKIPSLEDLMNKAQNTPAGSKLIIASDYLTVIKHLRDEKGFTWKQIAIWFREQGIPLSKSTITSAYHNNMP